MALGEKSFTDVSSVRASASRVALLAATLIMSGCGMNAANAQASVNANSAPMTTVVFMGDSLTAGYQNGALLETQQVNGYAALVAAKAGVPFTLPLITEPGIPGVLSLDPGIFPPVAGASGLGVRANPSQQPTDLAVPGFRLDDLLHTAPTPSANSTNQLLINQILGYPTASANTELQQAIALHPANIVLWIGNNDALVADFTGDPTSMTSLASFTQDFTLLMNTLKTQTSARLFVLNIPNVLLVPYLTPASMVLSEVSASSGIPQSTLASLLGLQQSDLLNASGLATVTAETPAILAGSIPPPLPAGDMLTLAQQTQVLAMISQYNQVIAQQVNAVGGTLIDINSYLNTIASGVTINGHTATMMYLGGLFGLDGIHLTNTGYALIANQVIRSVNTAVGGTIPLVNVNSIAAQDPYFDLPENLFSLIGDALAQDGVRIAPSTALQVDAIFKQPTKTNLQ